MRRQQVLSQHVPSYAERKRKIEGEPLSPNVGALLDAAVSGHEDRPALHFFEEPEGPVTYRELRDRVNQLANGLLERGVTRGTHVGVMLPNVVQFPITWLALARIGAAMVPINPAYTHRELSYVLEDGDVAFLIIHRDSLAAWFDIPASSRRLARERIYVVDAEGDEFESWDSLSVGQSVDAPDIDGPSIDAVLNLQYTSGTTGFPKACLLTHRYWLTTSKQNAFRDGRAYERILASTPFFYMDPQWQMLMAFHRHGCLYVARRQSASRFMQWVRQFRIDFALFPEVVLKQPPSPLDGEHELVRVNVYGLSKDNHALLEERFDVCAREAYGMTEVGTALFVPLEATDRIGSGSCGVPVPFREVRIVDEKGVVLGPDQVGELQVRGPGLMLGYYNKPEATANAFRDGWFRTGDLFRRDDAGYYYIVGRIKDMIRRAGENIAAHEVESVLLAFPEVAETAVVPVKDDIRGEEVKAYVVPQAGIDPHSMLHPLIEHCTRNLAPFKVPRYLEFRTSLPKTASGKISKTDLIAGAEDLREGSYDRVKGDWISHTASGQ